jgi:hypothetical protein
MKLLYPVPETAIRTGTYGPNLDGSMHYGIDWGVPIGTPITAAADGIVTRAGADRTGYGDFIRIEGNGFVFIYAHLSVIYVTVNEEVKAGQKIGLSGSTGNSSGPHLHFEVRTQNGEWPGNTVDPAPMLTADDLEEEVEVPTVQPGQARVTASVLNLRWKPRVDPATDVGDLRQGMVVEVIGDPVEADGHLWQGVKMWVAKEFLQ